MQPGKTLTTFPGRYATAANQLYRRDARGAVRSLSIRTLASMWSVTGRLRTALERPRVQVLRFQHVLEDEQVPFRLLLRALSRQHRFVSYRDAIKRIQSGRIEEPCVALTFDGGQRSGRHAANIMKEFGISACFFVCPALVGMNDYQRIRTFCLERLHIPPVPFLGWDDLAALREAGHEVGSLTMSHADLATLGPDEQAEEIGRSYTELKRRLGGKPAHFAWPYGRFANFSEEAARLVFDTGFKSCASIERGAHVPGERDAAPPCIHRERVLAGWPPQRILYLAAQNSDPPRPEVGKWPGWNL
ncbi:MAG: polysaccharide deacetylase family protein [Planctomycetota bacterium]|jgi:peptidoglycan/xylan/chitin deacetylase (PgdA/CDA1 family)